MHLEWPSVYRLAVHLENQQNITYNDGDDPQAVLEAAAAKDTQLTGWFKANSDPACIAAGGHDCLYQDFPKKFVWGKVKVKAHQEIGDEKIIHYNPARGVYNAR